MGAGGSVPSSVEEARAQGISEEDINAYIAEHNKGSEDVDTADVSSTPSGTDSDVKPESTADASAELDSEATAGTVAADDSQVPPDDAAVDTDAANASSAPSVAENPTETTAENSAAAADTTAKELAFKVGSMVEVKNDPYGWDAAKVTEVQNDGKYTVFYFAGYYVNESIKDIPQERMRVDKVAEEKNQPPDKNGMQLGSAVEVNKGFGSDGWEPAVITFIEADGTYAVQCTEGYYLCDTENGVPIDRIRARANSTSDEEAKADAEPDYASMTVGKLREMLRTRGAEAARLGFPNKELYRTKGRKSQLIERLIEVDRVDAERAALAPVSEVEKRRREEEARLAAVRADREAKLRRLNFPVVEAMDTAEKIKVPEVSELKRATRALDNGTDTISFQPPDSDDEEEYSASEDEIEAEAEAESERKEGEGKEEEAKASEGKEGEGKEGGVDEAKESEGGHEGESKTTEKDSKTEQDSAKTDESKGDADGVMKRINWKHVAKDIRLVHSCFVSKKLPSLDLSMKRIDGDALADILQEEDPRLHTLK